MRKYFCLDCWESGLRRESAVFCASCGSPRILLQRKEREQNKTVENEWKIDVDGRYTK